MTDTDTLVPAPSTYTFVTSDTFSTFIWTNQKSVCIHKCLRDIHLNDLVFCRDTLVHIKFTGLTKVSNIKSLLLNCPNLRHLTFNDALIDDYQNCHTIPSRTNKEVLLLEPESRSESKTTDTEPTTKLLISNPTVSHLTIICPLELSKNEYWLINFFTNDIHLPNLISLSFYSFTTIGGGGIRGNQGQGQGQGQPNNNNNRNNIGNGGNQTTLMWKETTEVMDKYGPHIDTHVICKFLLKYRRTLEKLWIGRPAFELQLQPTVMVDSDTLQKNEVDKLNEIKLNFLSVSIGSSGVNYLLDTQNHLETLNLVSNINLKTVRNIPKLMQHIFECISRNRQSLKEVKLVPTIITSSHNFDRNRDRRSLFIIDPENGQAENTLDQFTVDCSIFSQCSKLEYLCLSLRAYRDEFEMWSDFPPILQGTKLKNLDQIPLRNLVELCLPVEEYSRDELEKLAEKFKAFLCLKKFYFGTSQLNPSNSFLIRLSWIQDLVGLPQIEKVVFHNGVLQDVDGTRRIIQGGGQSIEGGHDGAGGGNGGAAGGVPNNGHNENVIDAEIPPMRGHSRPIITMIYNAPRYTFEISRRRARSRLRAEAP